jgi:hypothetical protein
MVQAVTAHHPSGSNGAICQANTTEDALSKLRGREPGATQHWCWATEAKQQTDYGIIMVLYLKGWSLQARTIECANGKGGALSARAPPVSKH